MTLPGAAKRIRVRRSMVKLWVPILIAQTVLLLTFPSLILLIGTEQVKNLTIVLLAMLGCGLVSLAHLAWVIHRSSK